MCYAICIGMIVASVAGIAYGYNYCMAEFLTLTSRSEVTVFMRRGKFYDPPDIKAPLIYPLGGRRSGDGGFEEELNANMSSDYDESLRRARGTEKSLGEAWVKSDDTRRYAERLTKFSDSVDSNDVILVSVQVTPSTTMEDTRRKAGDDSGKYSDHSGEIMGSDNSAERSKTTLSPTMLETQKYGDYVDKTWNFAEQFSKYADKEKLEDTALSTTTLDTRYGTNNLDSSWQFAEQLSKYVDGKQVEDNANVVKVETPAPFSKPTRTPGWTELAMDTEEVRPTRGPGYLNFLKPLRTTESKKTTTSEELNNYTKGDRINTRKSTLKRTDSRIQFVERKHQDNKATPAPMRHWATRSTTRASSSEEYSSSEEDDEDIVYKSV